MSKDRDFDGHLTFEEFMGEETPVEKAFKNMDEDGDGLVTKQVFIACQVQIIPAMREVC